jgi:regulator of replication initiation timing
LARNRGASSGGSATGQSSRELHRLRHVVRTLSAEIHELRQENEHLKSKLAASTKSKIHVVERVA